MQKYKCPQEEKKSYVKIRREKSRKLIRQEVDVMNGGNTMSS